MLLKVDATFESEDVRHSRTAELKKKLMIRILFGLVCLA